jgi:hypothetical protein
MDWQEIEARMRPGRFSQDGFLGPNENLLEVLASDANVLDELGIASSTLADRLGALLGNAIDLKVAWATGEFRVRIRRYKGIQLCPFGGQPHETPCLAQGDKRLASIDWSIENRRIGMRLSGPGLIVHLISAHGFFEGLHSPHRVPPRELARLLELGANRSEPIAVTGSDS